MTNSSDDRIRYLEEALHALPEAVAVFDDAGRFVFWNAQFEAIYGEGVAIHVGRRFEDHLWSALARGLVPTARNREAAWVAERLARFEAADGVHEHRLGDGRWLRIQDRALPSGGRVGIRTDITTVVERQNSVRMLYDGNPTPMLVVDAETLALLSANAAAMRFYGYGRDALLRLRLTDLRPETQPGEIAAAMERMRQGAMHDIRAVHRTAAGEQRIVKVSADLIDFEGRPAVLAAVFDVTAQEQLEAEMQRARALQKQVLDQIPTALFVKDMDDHGRYVMANRATETVYGIPVDEMVGRLADEVFDAGDAAQVNAQDKLVLERGSLDILEDDLIRREDGSTRIIRTRKLTLGDGVGSRPRYIIGVGEDVTEQRASAARIVHMAHHDLLTDLPNRVLLLDRLRDALARPPERQAALALLYLDLDGFKAVNDAWGHAVGDALLQAVGVRLRALLRDGDVAARLGGDEFALMQAPLDRPRDAERLARRIIASMSVPFEIENHALRIGASIGIALAPAHGTEAEALLARADAALYRAKREGRHTFRLAA